MLVPRMFGFRQFLVYLILIDHIFQVIQQNITQMTKQVRQFFIFRLKALVFLDIHDAPLVKMLSLTLRKFLMAKRVSNQGESQTTTNKPVHNGIRDCLVAFGQIIVPILYRQLAGHDRRL